MHGSQEGLDPCAGKQCNSLRTSGEVLSADCTLRRQTWHVQGPVEASECQAGTVSVLLTSTFLQTAWHLDFS